MGVTVGVQSLGLGTGQHSGAVSAAHLTDVVPQVFVAHNAGQHPAVGLPLHGPGQDIIVHAAVNDKRLVHGDSQHLCVGLGSGAALGSKGTAGQQGTQLCQRFLAAMQADGQGCMIQHLFPHRFQLFAHGGPVGLFQQAAQEVVPGHAAAPLTQGILH